ncbi:MAG: hypothetical protein EOP59_18630 [Sphingomonadales bacterium]|nr:MAG: hypothetical protein EOP59_18630 [Sphingomonadales bacterium]
MHGHQSATGERGQLRLFIASLWLTLATALFCAIVPVGLPHTEVRGSAFNPANSVVALHSSSSSNRATLRRSAEGEPAPAASAGSDIIAPSDVAVLAAPLVVASAPLSTPHTPFTVYNPRIAAFPRGPPAA